MKRLKGKVIVLVLVSALVGGITVHAASNYYADLIGNQEEQMKDELMEFYEKKYKERSKQVHNDLVSYTAEERRKLIEYFKPIIVEQINQDAVKRQNKHADEINKEVKRLRQAIYEMLEKELGRGIDRG